MSKFEFYIDETNAESGPVVRWTSSNNIPFPDMLERFWLDGQISREIMVNSIDYRKIEDQKTISEYIAYRSKNGYSDEEMFEMQASFGADEEVVDVFTGNIIRL